MLFVPTDDGEFVIGHDGSNEPAINTAARINPGTGDAIVVLETGNPILATTLAGEWVFWKTGKLDTLMFLMAKDRMVNLILAGWGLIIFASILIGWRRRRKRSSR